MGEERTWIIIIIIIIINIFLKQKRPKSTLAKLRKLFSPFHPNPIPHSFSCHSKKLKSPTPRTNWHGHRNRKPFLLLGREKDKNYGVHYNGNRMRKSLWPPNQPTYKSKLQSIRNPLFHSPSRFQYNPHQQCWASHYKKQYHLLKIFSLEDSYSVS